MPWYKGQSYTGFRGVDLKGSTYIRLHGNARGSSGTLTFDSTATGDRAWRFPAKSGTFPVSGTFYVSLIAYGKGNVQSTAVTVSGITAEDGIVATVMGTGAAIGGAATSAHTIVGARPGAGVITLQFSNNSSTDAGTEQVACAYTAIR